MSASTPTNPKVVVVFLPPKTEAEDQGRRKIPCLYCDEEFELFFDFGDHASQKHSETVDGRKVYKCTRRHCNKLFYTLKDVVAHERKLSELDNVQKMIAEKLEQDTHSSSALNSETETPSSSNAPATVTGTDQRHRFSCNECRILFFDWNTFFEHCWEAHRIRGGLALADNEGRPWLQIPPPEAEQNVLQSAELPVADSSEQHEFYQSSGTQVGPSPSMSGMVETAVNDVYQTRPPGLPGSLYSQVVGSSEYRHGESTVMQHLLYPNKNNTEGSSMGPPLEQTIQVQYNNFQQYTTTDISYIHRGTPYACTPYGYSNLPPMTTIGPGYIYPQFGSANDNNPTTGFVINPSVTTFYPQYQ